MVLGVKMPPDGAKKFFWPNKKFWFLEKKKKKKIGFLDFFFFLRNVDIFTSGVGFGKGSFDCFFFFFCD